MLCRATSVSSGFEDLPTEEGPELLAAALDSLLDASAGSGTTAHKAAAQEPMQVSSAGRAGLGTWGLSRLPDCSADGSSASLGTDANTS